MNKSRLIFAALLVLLIVSNVYTQDAAKKATKRPGQDGSGTRKVQQEEAPQTNTGNVKRPGQDGSGTRKVQQEAKPTSTKAAAQEPLKFFVFTESCFNKFINGQIDIECVKFTISKVLSYGIIGGSVLYKAPQIIKVLSSQSVQGLSLSSFYFQLIMVLFTIGYNLHIKAPISTYAENISVSVQTAILIALHWKLNPKTSKLFVLASIVAFSAIGAVMYLDILPDRVYDFIGIINIVLFVLAVAPQIKMNHQNRGTGQLAFVTVFLAWAGNLARVFTTLQEVKDPILLALFLTGVVLNGTVLLQFFIYGKPKAAQKVADKKRA